MNECSLELPLGQSEIYSGEKEVQPLRDLLGDFKEISFLMHETSPGYVRLEITRTGVYDGTNGRSTRPYAGEVNAWHRLWNGVKMQIGSVKPSEGVRMRTITFAKYEET